MLDSNTALPPQPPASDPGREKTEKSAWATPLGSPKCLQGSLGTGRRVFLYHLLDGDGAGAALDFPSWGFVICKMSTVIPRTGGFMKRTKVKVPCKITFMYSFTYSAHVYGLCATH